MVAALLVAHAVLAVGATLPISSTCDEVAHLTAGYSYWRTGYFRLVPEHPPLAELWATLPLAVSRPSFPALDQESWFWSDQWRLGKEFLYELGNDADTLLLYGRCMIVLLSVSLGAAVYLWSRRLFGPGGGLLSLALYSLSPTMLAHGALVTTDMAAGLFFILSIAGLWSVLHRVSLLRVLLSALAVAGLMLSKMSAVLIVPIAIGLVAVRLIRSAPLTVAVWKTREVRTRSGCLGVMALTAAAHIAIVYVCVWSVYGLHYEAIQDPVPGRDHLDTVGPKSPYESSWEHELGNVGGRLAKVIGWARDHRVLPESFLYGLAYTVSSTDARAAFLNGERSVRGFRRYFPYSFLIKTPLPLFGVVVLALIACGTGLSTTCGTGYSTTCGTGFQPVGHQAGKPFPPSRKPVPQAWLDGAYRTAPLWILLMVYWWSAVTSHINIGHRHILPVYPAVFILCGAAAGLQRHRSWAFRWSVPAILALYACASLGVWPHSLAYFNSLVGGPETGYRHLVDSSIDWGQDLKRLAKRLKERETVEGPNTREAEGDAVYLAYAGNAPPSHYGIEPTMLPSYPQLDNTDLYPLKPGLYCISATMLQQVYLLPMSRWTPALERAYRMCLPKIREINQTAASGGLERTPQSCPLSTEMLLKLRFGRLCATLRHREPDGRAGYSILIYQLTEEQISEALFEPPAELGADAADELCEFALELSKAGAGDLAIEFLREAATMGPDNVYIRRWLGFACQQQGLLEEAFEHYRHALLIDPRARDVYANLGLILASRGQLAEAVEMYRQGLDIQPRNPEIHANLALALAGLGKAEEAIASANRAVQLRPRDPALGLQRARVLRELGRESRPSRVGD